MYPDEIVQEVTGTKEEQERIMMENHEAKMRHSARKEQEMFDKPFLFERAIKKIKQLFNIKEKEKEQAAHIAAQKQQNTL